ncbi:hypothetical protein MMC29_008141, partial [Sticta canariensis]|nr:hypothetical protein [Sticta canariensis]
MNDNERLGSESGTAEAGRKKSKQWQVPKTKTGRSMASIESGDCGIWVTCDKDKEAKCTVELRQLFEQYASTMYGVTADGDEGANGRTVSAEMDIEAAIKQELEGMKRAKKEGLFQPVRVDIACVLFFKTRPPIEPVAMVQRICWDAFESSATKNHRWIRRLTPMTRMGRATEKGLDEVSKAVLGPVFHAEGALTQKFAIRTTIRHHHVMNRDDVIRQVAAAVGDQHLVDLKHYDRLILVEIYRNVCGMSVVGPDFETLKRFNLAEIYEPTSKRTKTGTRSERESE